MGGHPGGGWARLAELIRAEMPAAGYSTVGQLARRAGVSRRTVEDLLAGKRTRYKDDTLYGLETALGWEHEPSSVQRVVEGGKPIRVKDHGLARVEDAWPRLSERDRRIVLAIIELMSRG